MQRNNSSQVAALIAPVHGCRDALRRKGIEPTDFHKQNIELIKSLQHLKVPEKKPPIKSHSISKKGKNIVNV